MPQQRRRRSRGRGAPPPEPVEGGTATALVEPEAIKIPSGATVRDVAEHLGMPGSGDIIKALMDLRRDVDAHPDAERQAIGVLAY